MSGRHHASRCHMTQRDGPRDPHRGPTQGTHTGDPHRGDPHRGPKQGTHTEGRAPQRTHHRRGGPHRGPTQDTHRHAPTARSRWTPCERALGAGTTRLIKCSMRGATYTTTSDIYYYYYYYYYYYILLFTIYY